MKPDHIESINNVNYDDNSKQKKFPWKIYLIIVGLALLAAKQLAVDLAGDQEDFANAFLLAQTVH